MNGKTCEGTLSYTNDDDGVWLNYDCGHSVNLGFWPSTADVANADVEHTSKYHIAERINLVTR